MKKANLAKQMTTMAAALVTAGVLSVGAAAGTAAAAPVAEPCGFYETSTSAYYRHCGSTTIEIRVDYWNNTSGYECVGPWSTMYLGRKVDVDYAVYQHVGCP
ncbi:DUF6355 family natural product biosynthesis protein [Streptomyces sp. NPDC057199]|uniref:DUF6355 family natural product biosynthesis protein n=1 Tax=Streptomyces sp. NPDC057199 TaxID=3346047 RepID=UPI003625A87A